MKRSVIFFLLSVVLLSGCAKTIQMSQNDRERIKTVSVKEEITLPPHMYYFGHGQSLGLLFGLIGGAIAGSSALKTGDEIALFAKENGIHIERIVQEEFTNQLASSGKFGLSDQAGVDAELQMDIIVYGISIPHGFSKKFIPVLKVEAKLIDLLGTVVWQDNDYVFGSHLPGFTLEEISENPEHLRESWEAAARQAAANVIEKM